MCLLVTIFFAPAAGPISTFGFVLARLAKMPLFWYGSSCSAYPPARRIMPQGGGASVQAECHGAAGRAVAGQGKGEIPEAFNQIGMHTDVV